MGAPEEARLRDAIDYMKEAEKNTLKGWFKKPDWDIAAQYFEKAGQAFKAGKSYEQAIQAFIKASDSMIAATSLFMAGRAMENAANIALQNLGQPERAAEMYKRASDLFMQNAAPDRAAEMLEKGAKAMEPISVDSAIELYIGACNIYESEDRARFATDTFKRTISLLVKHKRLEKAIEVLQRLGSIQKETPNKTAYYKTLLSIIIVYLAAGDEVEAGKRFQAYCGEEGFVRTEESAIAHSMLDAFEHHDQAYYNQTANRQHVGFLDNEVARLARNIVISNDLISGGGYVEPSQPSIPHPRQQQYQRLQQQQQVYRPQHQQQPSQNHGPALASAMESNPFQPKGGPYSSQQGQNEIYRAVTTPTRPDPSQQRPLSANSGRYDDYHPSSVPPPYNDVRSESDWRALTDKPNPTSSPPPQLNHQQFPPNNQAGGAPSQGYYQGLDDGEDDLL